MEKILLYLTLSMIPGIGPVTQNRLLEISGSIENSFLIEAGELRKTDQILPGKKIGDKRIKVFLDNRNHSEIREKAEAVLEDCRNKGISILCKGEPSFPLRFSNIPEMPIVIYVRGSMEINRFSESVGIVGARRCSQEGKSRSIEIAQTAVSRNAAVISGMAKGIDSYAHTAALKMNGYTIAVLGNGVDICYPKEHQELMEEIAAKGALVSEYIPGTKPSQYRFPRRNQIIAALSDNLYVLDAGRNSGTKTTVEASGKYQHKVIL